MARRQILLRAVERLEAQMVGKQQVVFVPIRADATDAEIDRTIVEYSNRFGDRDALFVLGCRPASDMTDDELAEIAQGGIKIKSLPRVTV